MFRSFDILFFQGSDPLSKTLSFVMRMKTGNGSASHVGVVVKGNLFPEHPNIDPKQWYVWETTASGRMCGCYTASPVVDVVTGNGRLGTQIRPLQPVIDTYVGDVCWGPVLNNPTAKKEDETEEEYQGRMVEIKKKVAQLFGTYGDLNYDVSVVNCFYALFPACRIFRCCTSAMICSQLVGTFLQELDVIDKKYDPRDMVPVDFFCGVDDDGMPGVVREEDLVLLEKSSEENTQV